MNHLFLINFNFYGIHIKIIVWKENKVIIRKLSTFVAQVYEINPKNSAAKTSRFKALVLIVAFRVTESRSQIVHAWSMSLHDRVILR